MVTLASPAKIKIILGFIKVCTEISGRHWISVSSGLVTHLGRSWNFCFKISAYSGLSASFFLFPFLWKGSSQVEWWAKITVSLQNIVDQHFQSDPQNRDRQLKSPFIIPTIWQNFIGLSYLLKLPFCLVFIVWIFIRVPFQCQFTVPEWKENKGYFTLK